MTPNLQIPGEDCMLVDTSQAPKSGGQEAKTVALELAIVALESIALAGMSGSGQESEEGMRDWHARRAWEFIGIAARALERVRAFKDSTTGVQA